MRYIVSRVSTKEQNVENQTKFLKEKYPDATVIEDSGISGTSDKKSILKLVPNLKKGDEVIVYKLDRLSRSQTEIHVLDAMIEKRGAKLISATENISDDPQGLFLKAILAGYAQFEKEMISQRTKLALQKLKAQGKELGGIREGAGRKKVFISELEFEYLKNLRDKGLTWEQIMPIFNHKFKERNWSVSSIKRHYKQQTRI